MSPVINDAPSGFLLEFAPAMLLPGPARPRMFSNKGDVGAADEIARGTPITIPGMHGGVSNAAACAYLRARPLPSINPTGKSLRSPRNALSSPFCKNILVFRKSKSVLYPRHPVPHRGALRNVTDAGRGAVDAYAPLT
ncbi:MAG: hypothetical protein WCA28_01115, partial [Bradyrhizobium sp.]